EPTAHLDAPHQHRLVQHLRARVAAGDTVVTVLHDLNLALQADRVVVLRQGRVQADGQPGQALLHAAIEAAFDHAVCIRELATPSSPRWVAVLEQLAP
ncbi:MAG: ABC transporter ATP-binding protein, partial [Rubrivivax sp.]